MTSVTHDTTPIWNRRGDNWRLTRNGRTLAVIEPSWSDHHFFLFIADGTGDLVHDGTYGHRLARLRIVLRLWYRRT